MRKPFKPLLMSEAEDEAKLIASYLCEFADSETLAANSLAMHEARVSASHLCRFKIYHRQIDHLANSFLAAALIHIYARISELQRRKALLLMYQEKKARLDQLKEIRKYLTYS